MDDELPYHLVVGLPALSPTMEAGSLAEWYVDEGDSFAAGDAIAKIETDKASIDFEAQDDGYVAKLLMEAGTGKDVPLGTPIMVTVEEEEHIAAFKDFVPKAAPEPAKEEPAAAAPVKETPPAPVVETAAPEPPTPPPTENTAPAATPPPPPAAAPVEPPPIAASTSYYWGSAAKTASPLAKSLSAKQQAYIDKYGSTGQVPL